MCSSAETISGEADDKNARLLPPAVRNGRGVTIGVPSGWVVQKNRHSKLSPSRQRSATRKCWCCTLSGRSSASK